MKYNLIDFIQMKNFYEIDSLLKKNVERIELFFDEDSGKVYGVYKGDLDLYWLKKETKQGRVLEKRNENPFL